MLGVLPVVALLACFEILVPENLLAEDLSAAIPVSPVDLTRYILFITIGAIHILICIATVVLSIRNLLSRISRLQMRDVLFKGIIGPFLALSAVFVTACLFNLKIYRISFSRVVGMLEQSADFSYQYEVCSRNPWLQVFCASGNLHLSAYAFMLILFGLVATISVCADIGVSNYHHGKSLTPKRLAVAGNEMRDDINRYAASLLLVLTSSSVAISIFQQLGNSLLAAGTADLVLYQRAALAASLFWPLAFGSVFIGIFTIPALSILEKRGEALRLLDANEISNADYEGFFAVRQAFPQSLRWMFMSGLPLVMSLAPRLIEFTG